MSTASSNNCRVEEQQEQEVLSPQWLRSLPRSGTILLRATTRSARAGTQRAKQNEETSLRRRVLAKPKQQRRRRAAAPEREQPERRRQAAGPSEQYGHDGHGDRSLAPRREG
ncbi:unnamed protein product [Amoebophrya sp. A120]|nr:unnamed protein product [Amoebophrya sp. A120]|eukprot:GSA120T00003196001.1